MRLAAILLGLTIISLAGCLEADQPPAPAPTGRIDGAVLGPFLSPYGNHTVRLIELDRQDTTSPLGGFTFRDVPVGTYNLTAGDNTTHPLQRQITVRQDHISRIILQLEPFHIPFPHVAYLQRHGSADVALPGEACDACAWSTPITDVVDAVIVAATWDSPQPSQLPLGGTMLIEVFNQDGELLAELKGRSPLGASLPASSLAALERLEVRATFGPDFVPQKDFEMDSFLTIYHDIEPQSPDGA